MTAPFSTYSYRRGYRNMTARIKHGFYTRELARALLTWLAWYGLYRKSYNEGEMAALKDALGY